MGAKLARPQQWPPACRLEPPDVPLLLASQPLGRQLLCPLVQVLLVSWDAGTSCSWRTPCSPAAASSSAAAGAVRRAHLHDVAPAFAPWRLHRALQVGYRSCWGLGPEIPRCPRSQGRKGRSPKQHRQTGGWEGRVGPEGSGTRRSAPPGQVGVWAEGEQEVGPERRGGPDAVGLTGSAEASGPPWRHWEVRKHGGGRTPSVIASVLGRRRWVLCEQETWGRGG